MKEHVSCLSSRVMAGRIPGPLVHHKAQTYLIEQLEGIGMTLVLQPISIAVKDSRALELRSVEGYG